MQKRDDHNAVVFDAIEKAVTVDEDLANGRVRQFRDNATTFRQAAQARRRAEGALEHLDQQLDSAARDFINDSDRNSFDVEQRKAALSSIFRWFEMDFVEAAGSLQAYLAQFVEDEKAVDLLERDAFEVDYLRYDWSLNGKR